MEFTTMQFVIFTLIYVVSAATMSALAFGIYRFIKMPENVLAILVAVSSLAITLWAYTTII